MVQFLRTEFIAEKKLIGKSVQMSYSNNLTPSLWQSFMPFRNEVKNRINDEFISMQIFPKDFHNRVDINKEFEKWAAVEISSQDEVPNEMSTFTIPAGEYAVFLHKGSISEARNTFMYIFGEWLPKSEYNLDLRPHFEVLGEKYNKDSPESEEEIFIPIVKK